MNTVLKVLTLTAVAGLGAVGGYAAKAASGASDDPRLQTTSSMTDGKVISVSGGETPEALARAAAQGVTKYEDDTMVGGGGAPEKTLIDNDVV